MRVISSALNGVGIVVLPNALLKRFRTTTLALLVAASWSTELFAQDPPFLQTRALAGRDNHQIVEGASGPLVAIPNPTEFIAAKARADYGVLEVFAQVKEGGLADVAAVARDRFTITGGASGTPMEFDVSFVVDGGISRSHVNTAGFVGAYLVGLPTAAPCPPYPGLTTCTAAVYEELNLEGAGQLIGSYSQTIRVQLVAGQAYDTNFTLVAHILHFGGPGAPGTFVTADVYCHEADPSYCPQAEPRRGARFSLTPVTTGASYTTASGHRYDVPVTNDVPTAHAGSNQTVRPNTTVQLDGSSSFDDNTPTNQLQFAWSFVSIPDESAVTLASSDTMAPTFAPDLAGDYVVALIVTDQGGLSSTPSHVTIGENPPPTADAGIDQLVLVGNSVALTGMGTDPDSDALSFEWSLTAVPSGSAAQVANPTLANASFVPDQPGVYTAELTVSDPFGPGAPDAVQITAITAAGYAEILTQSASAELLSLPGDAVTNRGNRNALIQFLSSVVIALQGNDLSEARQQLEHALSRTDGCALRSMPDGNGPSRDWVTNCDAQGEVYPALAGALAALTP